MILKFDWSGAMFLVVRFPDINGRAFYLDVVLNKHTVVNGGYPCGSFDSSIIIKTGSCPDDIIGLPLSRLFAGTYSLFTIPDKDKWTIIINSEVGLWGAYNYNEKLDVMRFDVVANHENVIYEPFTMEFVQKNELADLLIYWDNVKVSIPLKFLN